MGQDIVDAVKENKSPALEEFFSQAVYDKEKYDGYAKIIKDFTDLYYTQSKQTWCNTRWRGVPVFKTPTDLWIYQELIEQLRPDLIIETGTCYGGSALFLRDMLNTIFKSVHVMSIDITHKHVAAKAKVDGIEYITGSSTDDGVIARIKKYMEDAYVRRTMILLDSDHSKEHVLKELALYAPLVTVGGVLIVEDTNVEGPFDAVEAWAPQHPEFCCDLMCEKLMLTFNRGGYFERVA